MYTVGVGPVMFQLVLMNEQMEEEGLNNIATFEHRAGTCVNRHKNINIEHLKSQATYILQ